MPYIELYNKDILDVINLGKTINDFNESKGDYIKVEIFIENSTNILNTFYSNRLLLKYSEVDSYHIGPYHYHPENPNMGFCTGKEHTNGSITNLMPISISGIDESLSFESNYKKQIDIFKDDNDVIYIKPNELLKLINASKAKYRLRIHFLRNIKSTLGKFLNLMKNNLIENGNFFAGLEATQTGDLDRSNGKNNFIKIENPGLSPFVLIQNGLPANIYKMWITGIEPNSNYIFSCWVAWSNNFNGDTGIVSFSDVSNEGGIIGLPVVSNTDFAGSYINDNSDRILDTKVINGLTWYRKYSFVQTDGNANLGSIMINLGRSNKPSTNPLGNRYFTNLRFEKVDSIYNGAVVIEYLNKLGYSENT